MIVFCLSAGCGAKTMAEQTCDESRTALTYQSFGQDFMSKHCQTCHGQLGSERRGAPLAYDFGTVELVRSYRERIYIRAASVNTTMPPGPDDPSADEREKLAQWLACDL